MERRREFRGGPSTCPSACFTKSRARRKYHIRRGDRLGRSCPGFPRTDGRRFAYVVVKGAGHLVPMDCPAVAAGMIGSFVEGALRGEDADRWFVRGERLGSGGRAGRGAVCVGNEDKRRVLERAGPLTGAGANVLAQMFGAYRARGPAHVVFPGLRCAQPALLPALPRVRSSPKGSPLADAVPMPAPVAERGERRLGPPWSELSLRSMAGF